MWNLYTCKVGARVAWYPFLSFCQGVLPDYERCGACNMNVCNVNTEKRELLHPLDEQHWMNNIATAHCCCFTPRIHARTDELLQCTVTSQLLEFDVAFLISLINCAFMSLLGMYPVSTLVHTCAHGSEDRGRLFRLGSTCASEHSPNDGIKSLIDSPAPCP